MTDQELYKDWLGGVTRGLFFEGGVYNNAPMEKFLNKEFGDVSLKRMIDFGITNVVDASFRDFSDKNITAGADLVDALFASLSVAGFFPPADVLNGHFFDGSAVWDIDIYSAINRCKDEGFAESDIVVDIIMNSAANLKDVSAEDYKSL